MHKLNKARFTTSNMLQMMNAASVKYKSKKHLLCNQCNIFTGKNYLSLTNLSCLGSRGLRFMISDSACSYASDIAGT